MCLRLWQLVASHKISAVLLNFDFERILIVSQLLFYFLYFTIMSNIMCFVGHAPFCGPSTSLVV